MHAQMAQVLLHPVVELVHRLGVVRRVPQHDIAVPSSVTRLSGSGRSSTDSQKSTACSATSRERERRGQPRLDRLLAAVHRRRRLPDHLQVAHG